MQCTVPYYLYCCNTCVILRIKGATSFTGLHNYNSIIYQLYTEAALACGLLERNTEWHKCLGEMQSTHTTHELSELFALICCFCETTSPFQMKMIFKTPMTEVMRVEGNAAENAALQVIDDILGTNVLYCRIICLPIPNNPMLIKPEHNVNDEGGMKLRYIAN